MSEKFLKSITFPDLSDKYVIADESLSESGAAADAKVVGDTKASIDGYYDEMTVGNAEQLVSNVRVNDKTPYIFRTSGGSVDIGDREYVNGIVGGTVAWNQQVHGDFGSDYTTYWYVYSGTGSVSNGEITVTNAVGRSGVRLDATKRPILINEHKYFSAFDYKSTVDLEAHFVLSSRSALASDTWKTYSAISNYIGAEIGRGCDFFPKISGQTGTFSLRNVVIIDLTQMFGSTIADYIYSLEQANAGAGVAWFKKLFNKPYYAYNAGELKSVSGLVSHDMTGFNQFDEVWESGYYDTVDGTPKSSAIWQRNKNAVKCLPNTSYCMRQEDGGTFGYILFYDVDGGYTGGYIDGSTSSSSNRVFTTPDNAYQIKFYRAVTANVGKWLNVNLAWDNSRNGEYEPYEKHSYALDSDLELRGIPKLDSSNNLYYDGDVYESDGTVNRRIAIKDLGELNWTKESDGVFYSNATSLGMLAPTVSIGVANLFCSNGAVVKSVGGVQTSKDGIGAYKYLTSVYLYYGDASVSSGADLKTKLTGVYLVYELETPTTETADPYQTPQIVSDFGTEEFVIDSDTFAVPVGHDTDYPIDLRAKLEMAPNSPSGGDGDYIVRQTNGMNEYVPLVIEDALPTMPSEAGTYKLTVTVADGADPVLSWEAE